MKKFILREDGFNFVFNTDYIKRKKMIFGTKGTIIEGSNHQEHSWRTKKGNLEILAEDGKIYSRFQFNKDSGRLEHTNDMDTRSLKRQYFEPLSSKINK